MKKFAGLSGTDPKTQVLETCIFPVKLQTCSDEIILLRRVRDSNPRAGY